MLRKETGFLALLVAIAFSLFHWSNAQPLNGSNDKKYLTPKLAGLTYVKNEVLLVYPGDLKTFVTSENYARVSKLMNASGLRFLGRVPLDGVPGLDPAKAVVCGGVLERWVLRGGTVLNAVSNLRGIISRVDNAYLIAPNSIGRPPQSADDWASIMVGQEKGSTGGKGSEVQVRVAVLDAHVRPSGRFALNDYWNAFAIWPGGGTPVPAGGDHGAGVTSIIAAASPVGLAQGIAKIDFMRVCNNDGQCFDHTVIPAYCRAVNRGARVINMSIASFMPSDLQFLAMRDAQNTSPPQAPLNVIAAGNSRSSDPQLAAMRANGFSGASPMFPAAFSSGVSGGLDAILAVGAIKRDTSYASFASIGGYIDVIAPGDGVPTYNASGSLTTAVGTSFSAPYISGAAAILIAQKPTILASSLEELIKTCVTPLPAVSSATGMSAGLLNIAKAKAQLASGTGTRCP
jgi:subtilisin family serine protease